MTSVICLWFCFNKVALSLERRHSGQRNRSGCDLYFLRQKKLLWHVLEQRLPVEVARLVVLNCVMIFFLALGKGEPGGVVPGLPVNLVLVQAAQR